MSKARCAERLQRLGRVGLVPGQQRAALGVVAAPHTGEEGFMAI